MPTELAEPVQAPPLPRVSLDKIDAGARPIARAILLSAGECVTYAHVDRWAPVIAIALDRRVTESLTDTLSQFVGRPIFAELANQLAYQLVSRSDELDRGPLLPYQTTVRTEWVGLEVQNVAETVWREDRRGVMLKLFALTGHPAGYKLERKVPAKFLDFFAYQLGFSRRVTYDGDPRHFIGLRFFAYVTPTPEGDMSFNTFEMTAKVKKLNSAVIKLRTRFEFEKADCMHDYEHECWDCAVGRTECRASIR
jgi:hypothetical protein